MNPILTRETQLRDEILRGLRGVGYHVQPSTHRQSGIPGIRVQTWEPPQGRMVEMLVIVGRPIPMDPVPEPEPDEAPDW